MATAGRDVYQAGRDQNFFQPPPPDPKLPAGRSPSNLPADTESLVARQEELELLARELLVPGKEVVIHGMPGVGKSALTLRSGEEGLPLERKLRRCW